LEQGSQDLDHIYMLVACDSEAWIFKNQIP